MCLKSVNVILNPHAKEYEKQVTILIIKIHNTLFNEHKDQVLNKGFRYVDGFMKSYEQNKKVYHMHIIKE
jgi:hypothetical protein